MYCTQVLLLGLMAAVARAAESEVPLFFLVTHDCGQCTRPTRTIGEHRLVSINMYNKQLLYQNRIFNIMLFKEKSDHT